MTSETTNGRSLQSALFPRLLSYWPVLVATGLLGGILGLAASQLLEPEYQSEAVLGVNINYGITESLELVVEDRVLGRVAAVVVADSTLEGALDGLPTQLLGERGWSDPGDLRPSLRLDRRLGEWALVATDQDPAIAALLADAWAEAAVGQLDEAIPHAWRAAALATGPFDIDCAQERNGDTVNWICVPSEGQIDPEALEGEIQTEAELSRGIPPILSYELLQSAQVPNSPVIRGRGTLSLAGATAGFMVGLIAILGGKRLSRWDG